MRLEKLFVIVACSASLVTGLGCDSGSSAELEAARAELEAARAELSSAREDLKDSAQRLDEATSEIKAMRKALDQVIETAASFSAQAFADLDAPEGASDREVPCSAEPCKVDLEVVRGLRDDPEKLARQARLVPSVENGETKGFKVYGIRSASLPKLFGLKNGDLLTAVNGASIVTLDDATAAYTTHRDAEKFVINIVRKGAPLVLHVELVEGGESPTLR